MIKLSFIKSEDRRYNVERALSLIKSEIIAGTKEAKRIVIKPNCESAKNKETATSKEALDGILKFIAPYAKSQIVLAEGSSVGETLDAFKAFGYLELQEKYDLAIIDLNRDEFTEIPLIDKSQKEWSAQFSNTLLESDYIISIAPPKTDDTTVFNGVIKNAVTGGLLRPAAGIAGKLAHKVGFIKNNKLQIQQGPKAQNHNIHSLYQQLSIKLAIIDGYETIEGDGQASRDYVPTRWAITSTNPVAVDCFACTMLGINYKDVGYLAMLENGQDEYFINGDDWQKSIRKIKMPTNLEKIKNWNT